MSNSAVVRILRRRKQHETAAPLVSCPYEGTSGSFPWYHECYDIRHDIRATVEEAYADAVAWAAAYEAADRFGNMATAFGVVDASASSDGKELRLGWVGVVNYYHSNT